MSAERSPASASGVQAVPKRDLLVLDRPGRLVFACDSVGGIGPREGDGVFASVETTAHFSLRGAVLEVLCAGARPIALINTLCQDRASAAPLIAELQRLAASIGIPQEAVTGTTEENVATEQTGIGIVVVGELGPESQRPAAQPGDIVVCVGWPRSAPDDEIYVDRPDLISLTQLQALLATGLVRDALPVGSRGLAWEVPQLAATHELTHRWVADQPVPISKSGGPSSCVLIACRAEDEATLRGCVPPSLPWHVVAELIEK